MSELGGDQAVFLTLVCTTAGRSRARLLIDSIRTFGGALRQCPVLVFEGDPEVAPCDGLMDLDVDLVPLTLPDTVRYYDFAQKVFACAQAESMVGRGVNSLIWMAPACLVINPPALFQLDPSVDAAVRPVHIRNVGLPLAEPVDRYWERVYRAVGVDDIQGAVETFVDRQRIRSYFNSHAFAVNPSKGLLRRWSECFEALVADHDYQAAACRDEGRQIFLHQAVLSALLATTLPPERVRLLPPAYNYPYNLHQSVPSDRRAAALNDLVCIAYEDRSLNPNLIEDIAIHQPLKSWLLERAAAG